jgi:D-alanyl-D-alanine-carboxypeptidase/D-alanyl-D-alanine-endopeptidase
VKLPLIATVTLTLALANFRGMAQPSDAEIRKILADRIDVQKQAVGVVVGVVTPQGRRVVAYGNMAADNKRPLDGDTVFEIGSITKVFTSLILMDMVQHGEVALDDPVSKHLPPEIKVPERGGKKITLRDLSTQTSALPRMPNNFSPKDPGNPYADYSVAQLYEFVSGLQLTRDIGEKYEYSNLGVGLLGHALSRRVGTDYEALVRARILKPLGMKDTAITLSPEMKARLTSGHNLSLRPVPNWDIPTLAGAGALRSTANDMLTYLAANLGLVKTPLAEAMTAQIATRRPTGAPNLEIAYGWHVFTAHDKVIYWHNGGTGGYRTFIGYDPKARLGVVALSNTSTPSGVDDIGRHLLDPEVPLVQKKEHKEIPLDAAVLDRYTGQYQLAPNFVLTVTRSDNQLSAQATGQGRFEIFPEGRTDFFAKVTELTISFDAAAEGKATGLTLWQAGNTTVAKRIGEATAVKERTAIKVDPAIFDRYAGRYEVRPGFVLTVSREGDRLMTQATNQPKFEIFPETERDYFAKAFDGQITFQTDGSGKATGLVIHQNGQDIPAKKVE